MEKFLALVYSFAENSEFKALVLKLLKELSEGTGPIILHTKEFAALLAAARNLSGSQVTPISGLQTFPPAEWNQVLNHDGIAP